MLRNRSSRIFLGAALAAVVLCTSAGAQYLEVIVKAARGQGATAGWYGMQVGTVLDPPLPSRTQCISMMTGATASASPLDAGFAVTRPYTHSPGETTALGASVVFDPSYYVPHGNPAFLGQLRGAAITEYGALCALGASSEFTGRFFSQVSGGIGNNFGSLDAELSITDRTNSFMVVLSHRKKTSNCEIDADCIRVQAEIWNITPKPLQCRGFVIGARFEVVELGDPAADSEFVSIPSGQFKPITYVGANQIFNGTGLNSPNAIQFPVDVVCTRCLGRSGPDCEFPSGEVAGGGTGTARHTPSNPPAATSHALSISKAGSGTGTVTSNPAGISCGATCTASFSPGTSVALTASASQGSTFAGWSGDCSGTGLAMVQMTAARSCTATFTSQPPPASVAGIPVPPSIGGGIVAYPPSGATPTQKIDPTLVTAGYGPCTVATDAGASRQMLVASRTSIPVLGAINLQLSYDGALKGSLSGRYLNVSNKGQSGGGLLYVVFKNGSEVRRMSLSSLPPLHPGSENDVALQGELPNVPAAPAREFAVALELHECRLGADGAARTVLVDQRSMDENFAIAPQAGGIPARSARGYRSNRVTVYQFHNPSLDRYFMTANEAEAEYLRATPATGEVPIGSFRANVLDRYGSADSVCRFYGSPTLGPNSHFFTVDRDECEGLKALAERTPDNRARWNFEGVAFAAQPTTGSCSGATPIPLYRVYNDGFVRNKDSNHRFTTSVAEYQATIARGWKGEGIKMCLPEQGRSTAGSTLSSYSGTARDVSAQFGGPPYCTWRVDMSNLRMAVVVTDGRISEATLTGTMTESIVGSCSTSFGTQPNSWSSAAGIVNGDSVNITMEGAPTNLPASIATFQGTLRDGRIVGTLTIRRTDQIGSLAWVLTTPVD